MPVLVIAIVHATATLIRIVVIRIVLVPIDLLHLFARWHGERRLRSKQRLDLLQLLRLHRVLGRILNVEPHKQVALLERITVDGHALALHLLDAVLFDDLARRRCDHQIPSVHVLDRELEAAQRLRQRDCMLDDQIVAGSLEEIVLLLHQHDHNVARLSAVHRLVALAGECDFLAVLHALVHVHIERFVLVHDALALALIAPIAVQKRLALAAAIGAASVYLACNAWTKVLDHHLRAINK